MAQSKLVSARGVLSALCLLSGALTATADTTPTPTMLGYFVAAHGGGAFPTNKYNLLNTGYNTGLGYGYQYDNYRTFLDFEYTNHDYSQPAQATYQLFDIMLNLTYDLNYSGHVIPFFGGGFGYMRMWSDQCSQTLYPACNGLQNGSRVSYQGIAGLGLRFGGFRTEVRYRYLSYINNANINFGDNIAELVLSYYFFRSNQLDN